MQVAAFNAVEGWSRDASKDIARALELRVSGGLYEVPDALRDFMEGQLGGIEKNLTEHVVAGSIKRDGDQYRFSQALTVSEMAKILRLNDEIERLRP